MAELNYHHLRYFHAVAHEGNLTRAAERLNLSQSALSVQIRKLEERLGQDLFERRGRQLLLTEAGRIALDHADAIFRTGRDLVETLKRTGAVRHPLRLGALATLSRNFQLSFLRPLLGRADVDLILRSGAMGELLAALQAHVLDIVLTDLAPPRDAAAPFTAHRIAEQPVALVGAARLVTPGASLAELIAAHPMILPSPETATRMAFDALADRLDVRCEIAAEVDDMAMMRLLAREGAGLALVSRVVVQDELASGLLTAAAEETGITEAFYAVTVARRFPNPLAAELLDAALSA